MRTTVGHAQKELRDLDRGSLAFHVERTLDLKVGRLGLISYGNHVVKDVSQRTFAKGDDAGIKSR